MAPPTTTVSVGTQYLNRPPARKPDPPRTRQSRAAAKLRGTTWQRLGKRVLSFPEREPAACSAERIRDPPLGLLRRWRPTGRHWCLKAQVSRESRHPCSRRSEGGPEVWRAQPSCRRPEHAVGRAGGWAGVTGVPNCPQAARSPFSFRPATHQLPDTPLILGENKGPPGVRAQSDAGHGHRATVRVGRRGPSTPTPADLARLAYAWSAQRALPQEAPFC